MEVHTVAPNLRLKTVQLTCATVAEVFEAAAEYVNNIPAGEWRFFGADYRDGGPGNRQIILYIRETAHAES